MSTPADEWKFDWWALGGAIFAALLVFNALYFAAGKQGGEWADMFMSLFVLGLMILGAIGIFALLQKIGWTGGGGRTPEAVLERIERLDTDMKARFDRVDENVEKVHVDVKEARKELGEIKTIAEWLKTELGKWTPQLEKLVTSVNELSERVKKGVEDITILINDLKTWANTKWSELENTVKTAFAELDKHYKGLAADVKATNDKVDAVEAMVENIQSEIGEVHKQAGLLEKQIAKLPEDVAVEVRTKLGDDFRSILIRIAEVETNCKKTISLNREQIDLLMRSMTAEFGKITVLLTDPSKSKILGEMDTIKGLLTEVRDKGAKEETVVALRDLLKPAVDWFTKNQGNLTNVAENTIPKLDEILKKLDQLIEKSKGDTKKYKDEIDRLRAELVKPGDVLIRLQQEKGKRKSPEVNLDVVLKMVFIFYAGLYLINDRKTKLGTPEVDAFVSQAAAKLVNLKDHLCREMMPNYAAIESRAEADPKKLEKGSVEAVKGLFFMCNDTVLSEEFALLVSGAQATPVDKKQVKDALDVVLKRVPRSGVSDKWIKASKNYAQSWLSSSATGLPP
ncbi:hypothetical protein HY489_03280 [Candidatus Woesearchaeota archaeon]|nr:hypothetical protein [Candidatus Woesearchaeota archaeon]